MQAIAAGWQKPIGLMRMIIARYMHYKGGWITDGWCGTGTTTIAALSMGMNAFYFDSEKKTMEAARARIPKFKELIEKGEVYDECSATQDEYIALTTYAFDSAWSPKKGKRPVETATENDAAVESIDDDVEDEERRVFEGTD